MKVLPSLYLILEKLFNSVFSNESRLIIFSVCKKLISIEKHYLEGEGLHLHPHPLEYKKDIEMRFFL
jgi:hypothetical protein